MSELNEMRKRDWRNWRKRSAYRGLIGELVVLRDMVCKYGDVEWISVEWTYRLYRSMYKEMRKIRDVIMYHGQFNLEAMDFCIYVDGTWRYVEVKSTVDQERDTFKLNLDQADYFDDMNSMLIVVRLPKDLQFRPDDWAYIEDVMERCTMEKYHPDEFNIVGNELILNGMGGRMNDQGIHFAKDEKGNELRIQDSNIYPAGFRK